MVEGAAAVVDLRGQAQAQRQEQVAGRAGLDGGVVAGGPGGPGRLLQVLRGRVQVGLQAAHAHALSVVVLLQEGAQPRRQRQLLHACGQGVPR